MTTRRTSLLYWVLFVLVAASLIVRIRLHGLAFPPPWPDESSFVWPALAFRDTGTLFAPEIHSRELFWMPPAYMIVSGAIFKLTGFSFEWARMLSGIYLCGAFACVCALARGLRIGLGSLALALVFLHSPIAAMAGNTARMETLMLLVAAGGFLLIERGFRATGLSLLALGPLVHPNGAFPLFGGALLCCWPTRTNLAHLRPRRGELVAILGAAAAWIAYVTHVALHFQNFKDDWALQLSVKKFQAFGQNPLSLPEAWVALSILILVGLAVRRFRTLPDRPIVTLSTLAGSLWLQTLITVGWLYEVHAIFMDFIAAILAVELASAWLVPKLEAGSRPLLARAAPAVLAIVSAALCARFAVTSQLAMRSVTPSTRGFWPAPPPYITDEDRAAVGKYLKTLASAGRPITVNFLPDADALAFQEYRTPTLHFSQPQFGIHHADVYIFHESRWLPEFLRGMLAVRAAFGHLILVPIDRWSLLRARDTTERWRVYRRPDRGEPAPAP